jgi:membrane-bound serine protease (ClpP class)
VETIAILILFGAVLLVLETLLPGLVAGLAGMGCLLAAVILAYVRLPMEQAHLVFLGVVAGLVVGTWLWFRYFPDSPLARRFISRGAVGELGVENSALLHQSGVAQTTLRPCGTAMIGGKRVDVVTEGGMIDPGTPLKVVAVEGMRVVVRAV